jgi:hypothetical protein
MIYSILHILIELRKSTVGGKALTFQNLSLDLKLYLFLLIYL